MERETASRVRALAASSAAGERVRVAVLGAISNTLTERGRRHGWRISQHTHYRGFLGAAERSELAIMLPAGADTPAALDLLSMLRAGGHPTKVVLVLETTGPLPATIAKLARLRGADCVLHTSAPDDAVFVAATDLLPKRSQPTSIPPASGEFRRNPGRARPDGLAVESARAVAPLRVAVPAVAVPAVAVPAVAAPGVHRLLLVGDEQALVERHAKRLGRQDFAVSVCSDFEHLRSQAASRAFDVVVVIGSGEPAALEPAALVELVHAGNHALAVMVVGRTMDEAHRIQVLDAGADDVIGPDVGVSEIDARIRVLVRRAARWSAPQISFSGRGRNRVMQIDELEVQVSPAEERLMMLVIGAGEAGVTADILKRDGIGNRFANDEALRGHYRRLRPKLGKYGDRLVQLENGRGWRFSLYERQRRR